MNSDIVNGIFALSGAIIGAALSGLLSWIYQTKSERRQASSELWLLHLSEILAVESRLGELPDALRFHCLDPETLKDAGITASEFAYLLNSFTLGRAWHWALNPEQETPFEEGSYRYNMCKSTSTRKAWPLVKQMISPSLFIKQVDCTIRAINAAEIAQSGDRSSVG